MEWHWEEIDENRSGSSGDVSKLFRNEKLKTPGFLETNAPPPDATIMAREVIQNSWDAAKDLRSQLGRSTPFKIEFEFREVDGDDRDTLITEVGLDQLAAMAYGKDWRELGIPAESILADIDSKPLRVLVIREHGTSGMYGPWKRDKSKMWLALVSVGYTKKEAGSGGSYGYGKAGLIRGSETRTVVAYTCFPERPDDPGVTRRSLGMTYWGPFENHTGFARLGTQGADGGTRPFEDGAADDLASTLGLALRSANNEDELGTTYLVVDPTVEPRDVLKAVERNWWPAIIGDDDFQVSVIDYEGHRLAPEPENNRELEAFIRGYELARGAEPGIETERLFRLAALEGHQMGCMGLVGDPSGWSYPNADDVDHKSLVALVRGPRMVVEYAESGYSKPYVRGTFIAHEDIDDLLRQSEPSAHDAWETHVGDDSTDKMAPIVAAKVYERVKGNVNSFRRALKPPVPDRRELRLPEVERLFRDIMKTDGSEREAPPRGEPREIGIAVLDQAPEVVPGAENKIRLRARVSYQLTERCNESEAVVWLGARYQFIEDERAGDDCPLEFTAPTGFEIADERLVGKLSHEPVQIDLVSDPYDPEWTGRLTVEAGLVKGTDS